MQRIDSGKKEPHFLPQNILKVFSLLTSEIWYPNILMLLNLIENI